MSKHIEIDFLESGTTFPELVPAADCHDDDTMSDEKQIVVSAQFIIREPNGRTWIISSAIPMEKGMTLDAALINAAVKAAESVKSSGGGHD